MRANVKERMLVEKGAKENEGSKEWCPRNIPKGAMNVFMFALHDMCTEWCMTTSVNIEAVE